MLQFDFRFVLSNVKRKRERRYEHGPVVALIIVSILVVAVVVVVVAMTVCVVDVVALIPTPGVAVVSMVARPIARRAAIKAFVVSSLGVVSSPALVLTSSRLSAVAGALLLPLLLADPRSYDNLAKTVARLLCIDRRRGC